MAVKVKLVLDTSDVEMVENPTEVHYRIIWSENSKAGIVVCVQDFDYYYYKEFIGDECFAYEEDAKEALYLMNLNGIHNFRNRRAKRA